VTFYNGISIREQRSTNKVRVKSRNIRTGGEGKGKIHPKSGHEGPEGEYRYTFALLDARWDVWLTPRPGRFTPGKDPVPIVEEAG
jgi:hypothetical protein